MRREERLLSQTWDAWIETWPPTTTAGGFRPPPFRIRGLRKHHETCRYRPDDIIDP
jgi:hypothetical protein